MSQILEKSMKWSPTSPLRVFFPFFDVVPEEPMGDLKISTSYFIGDIKIRTCLVNGLLGLIGINNVPLININGD